MNPVDTVYLHLCKTDYKILFRKGVVKGRIEIGCISQGFQLYIGVFCRNGTGKAIDKFKCITAGTGFFQHLFALGTLTEASPTVGEGNGIEHRWLKTFLIKLLIFADKAKEFIFNGFDIFFIG